MKIVVFSDGTGNSSAKLFRTNVWRLYEALDLCDNTKHVAFYDNGVGTASFVPLALLGGAFGFGLKRNVRDIYSFICRNAAKPGEHRIYAFGFSRGAFTIRVLLGLIEDQGLVPYNTDDRELTRMATWAYREYRRKALPGGKIVKTFRWIRDTVLHFVEAKLRRPPIPRYSAQNNRRDVSVAFVGLWDTVAAYGFPIIEMTRGWDRWVWPLKLPTRELVDHVDRACHALALDDERQTFHPLLWNEKSEPKVWRDAQNGTHEIGKIAEERLSQVWFSGMHSNVGGGYPDDGMAYESLCWIAEQAVSLNDGEGLLLKPGTLDEWERRCSSSSPMSDSRSGVGAYYRYLPRLVPALVKDHIHEIEIDRPKIHMSVLRRIKARIDGYAPIVLPDNYVVTDGRSIFEMAAPELGEDLVIETPAKAKTRFECQEQIWDLVWYRRIVYFTTVGVTLLTLALVLLPDSVNSRFLPWAFPTVSGTIALLSGLLPAVADPVLEHFETYPSQLVVGGLAALLFMRLSSYLERRITDGMRKVWAGEPPPPPSVVLRFARRVRTSPWYVTALDKLRYAIAPNVFGMAMLVAIVFAAGVVVIRLSFDVPMILGQVCKNVENPIAVTTNARYELREFDLTSPCHPMGARLRAGETYVISVEPHELHWRDATIPVSNLKGFKPAGFSLNSLWSWLTIPILRHKVMDWYVPVARVGAYGDHYFQVTSWTTEITPQTDGQLFLYVNDALSIPFIYSFYQNNNTCTVEDKARAGEFDTCPKPPREKWYIARKPAE
jgi:uncharacterized protein (DUF2235 family)